MSKQIMIIAGEHSGDMRAAEIIAAINRNTPGLKWFGIGGPRMRQLGVETRHDIEEMAVMGIGEVLRRYPFFRRTLHEMIAWAEERKPDLALFVDYPGFNLRLAKQLHARGIKTVFYICPQVWAWHRSRIPQMAEYLDHMLAIFPFEAEHFRETKLPVTYVGHPLVDSIAESISVPEYRLPWNGKNRIALLPGSRTQEIARLLPVMLAAADLLHTRSKDCGFLIAAAGEKQARQIARILQASRSHLDESAIITDHTRDIIAQADVAMVCSGTATLETALLGCPMVVCYKAHPITYFLIRPFIHVDYIGMVNIIAGKEACPELIQGNLTATKLAAAIETLIQDAATRLAMLTDIKNVQTQMGGGGAAENAARVIIGLLSPKE
ncbi:MAG: lipid-A-disaccharide synthase [Kiritimatiellia bacterium]